MNTVWAALIAGAVGVITTYLAAVLKLRSDVRFAYDKDLRDKRIPKYEELWKLTGYFPKYGRRPDLTYSDVDELSDQLRDWYFNKGGMFLSDEGRDAYFRFQEGLVHARPAQDASATLDPDRYEHLRGLGSNLRTALVRDVGTRRGPESAKETRN